MTPFVIFDILDKTPAVLRDFMSSIGLSNWNQAHPTTGWRIVDHACHIIEVQPLMIERLQRFLNEDKPVFKPYFPDQDLNAPAPNRDFETMIDQFDQTRKTFVEMLQTLSDEQLNKPADHPEYRQYTPLIMARHLMMHDHLHMYRMEELWLSKTV